MILILTKEDLLKSSCNKELGDITITDIAIQADLVFKNEIIVIYHSGLFKFLKCREGLRHKYLEILKHLELENDILPEYDFSKGTKRRK